MWQLNNITPFSAESSWVRGLSGEEIWLVVVKASFILDPLDNELTIEEDQPPVSNAASYSGESGMSSLLEDDHFVRLKKGTDILLNGCAYSPAGKPDNSVDVAISVGHLQKRLRVFGNRRWEHGFGGIRLSEPEDFTRMPIVYERAYGGPDLGVLGNGSDRDENSYPQNPIGVGYSKSRDRLIGQPAPNIEYPDQLVQRWTDEPASAGFGAIPCHWAPRVDYSGSYDEAWMQERSPLLALDTDPRYYHQAPLDQQYDSFLSGGEKVSLYNLVPPEKVENRQLHFSLPRMRLGFRTRFKDGLEHHSGRLHTVIFSPDELRVSLVWHTALECHNREHLLENTSIFQKDFSDG